MLEKDDIMARIKAAGWFKGTERDWKALSTAEQEEAAFAGCGCLVAYCTWPAPVDCLHTKCQIRRGELPKIALTNHILKSESQSGWLRFLRQEDRKALAGLFRAVRKAARETGEYDPWKLDWRLMVYSAIAV